MNKIKLLISILCTFIAFKSYSQEELVGEWQLSYIGCEDYQGYINKSNMSSMIVSTTHIFKSDGSFSTQAVIPFTCELSLGGSYNLQNKVLTMNVELFDKMDGMIFSCPNSGVIMSDSSEIKREVMIKTDGNLYFYDKGTNKENRCSAEQKPVQVFTKINQ